MCVVATAAATSEGLDPRSTIDRTTNRLDQALTMIINTHTPTDNHLTAT